MLLHLMACRCEYNLNVSTWHNFLWYLRPYNSTITYILVFFMYICWSVTIKGLFFCVKFHTWIEIIKAVASQPLMKTASRTAAQQCTHWNHLITFLPRALNSTANSLVQGGTKSIQKNSGHFSVE